MQPVPLPAGQVEADPPAVVMLEPAAGLTPDQADAILDRMRAAGTLPRLRHPNPPDVEALYLCLHAARQLAEKVAGDLDGHECPDAGRCDRCRWADAAEEALMFLDLFAGHVGDTLYGTGWRIEHLTENVRELVAGVLLSHHGV